MSWTPTLNQHEKTAVRRGLLQHALPRAQKQLDKLDRNAVILDGSGQAWQFGGWQNPYWYRAFGDDSFVSSFELVQIIRGQFTVIHPAKDADDV